MDKKAFGTWDIEYETKEGNEDSNHFNYNI